MAFPSNGALFVTNPKRPKSKSPYASIIAKLNPRGRKASKSRKGRVARRRGAGGRFLKTRSNGLAVRSNGLAVRSNGLAVRSNGLGLRANPLALRSNRKGNSRKAKFARRNGGLAYALKNPLKAAGRGLGYLFNGLSKRSRRNGGALVTPDALRPVSNLLDRVPVIGGTLASAVAPVLYLGAGAGLTYIAASWQSKLLPSSVTGNAYFAAWQNTIAGIAAAALMQFIPSSILSPTLRNGLSIGVIGAGAAFDAAKIIPSLAKNQYVAYLLPGASSEVTEKEDAAVAGWYSDASPFDAAYAGADFTEREGKAFLAGAHYFGAIFTKHQNPYRQTHYGNAPSQGAGQEGHRWGWLIKLIGFSNVRRIAALPAAQRRKYIADLKAAALALVPNGNAQLPQASGVVKRATGLAGTVGYHGVMVGGF